jgi:hypothetical protein
VLTIMAADVDRLAAAAVTPSDIRRHTHLVDLPGRFLRVNVFDKNTGHTGKSQSHRSKLKHGSRKKTLRPP